MIALIDAYYLSKIDNKNEQQTKSTACMSKLYEFVISIISKCIKGNKLNNLNNNLNKPPMTEGPKKAKIFL